MPENFLDYSSFTTARPNSYWNILVKKLEPFNKKRWLPNDLNAFFHFSFRFVLYSKKQQAFPNKTKSIPVNLNESKEKMEAFYVYAQADLR